MSQSRPPHQPPHQPPRRAPPLTPSCSRCRSSSAGDPCRSPSGGSSRSSWRRDPLTPPQPGSKTGRPRPDRLIGPAGAVPRRDRTPPGRSDQPEQKFERHIALRRLDQPVAVQPVIQPRPDLVNSLPRDEIDLVQDQQLRERDLPDLELHQPRRGEHLLGVQNAVSAQFPSTTIQPTERIRITRPLRSGRMATEAAWLMAKSECLISNRPAPMAAGAARRLRARASAVRARPMRPGGIPRPRPARRLAHGS